MKNLLCLCAILATLAACRKNKDAAPLECLSPITANFEVIGDDCLAPCQVQFNDLSDGADLFDWNFGDGSAGTGGANVIHTFQRPGLYQVSLKAGAVGTSCEDVQSKFVKIGSRAFEWGHVGSASFTVQGLVQTPNHGYLVSGRYHNGEQALYRLNEQGLVEWIKYLDLGEQPSDHWISPSPDGNYWVGGSFTFGTVPETIPKIAKINEHGSELWSRVYNTFEGVSHVRIAKAQQGGFWVAGNSKSHLFLGKADDQGAIEWTKTYPRDTLVSNHVVSILELEGGDLAVLETLHSPQRARLTRMSPAGDVRWEQMFLEHHTNRIYAMHHSNQQGFTLAGYMKHATGPYMPWFIRTDQQGNKLGERTYGGTSARYGLNMVAVDDGGFLLVGQALSMPPNFGNILLIRTDANGELLWERTRGGSALDAGLHAIQASDGGFAVAGITSSPELVGVNGIHLYILKTDAEGKVNQ